MFEEMHQLYVRGYTPKVKVEQELQCLFPAGNLYAEAWKNRSVSGYIDEMLSEEGK